MYKQVIVIRTDLKLTIGKAAAQASHASYSAAKKASRTKIKRWEELGQKKVVLAAKDLKELKILKKKAERLKISVSLIRDAGLTHIRKGTITALGIGPDKVEKIDKITGHLKLLK